MCLNKADVGRNDAGEAGEGADEGINSVQRGWAAGSHGKEIANFYLISRRHCHVTNDPSAAQTDGLLEVTAILMRPSDRTEPFVRVRNASDYHKRRP